MVNYRRNPLDYLSNLFKEGQEASWLPGDQLCIGEAGLAREVLRDSGETFRDIPHFFAPQSGQPPKRTEQLSLGIAVRDLIWKRFREHDIERTV